jgi:anti-sigma regulatory factor (Ser/Thr protein kinase)
MSASARLEKLEQLTDIKLARLDVDELLRELLLRVRDILDVDTAAVLTLEEASDQLEARAASGIEEEVRQGVRIPLGTGFAGRIAATKQPVRLDRVDDTTVANPILWETGIKVMLGVPLLRGDHVLGVLHIGRLDRRPFSDEDLELLQVVADRVAGAVTARRFALEQAAALVLERSLLPAKLPKCPGLAFAARYVPAEARTVGGDWYDLFMLPTGQLWIVVGDVAGHGLQSAISMGRIRSALRAYTMLGLPPEEVLDLVDRKVDQFELGTIATIACAVSAPPYNSFSVALAGHPPPVIVEPGRPAAFAELRPSPPIGTNIGIRRRSETIALVPGSVIAFYTDGLVERRDEPLDDGLERLRRAVATGPPDHVAGSIMRHAVGNRVTADDIALVVISRTDTTTTSTDLRYDPSSAAFARRHVETFVAAHHLEHLTHALATIATELVTNAVLHGAPPIGLELRRDQDSVTIEVSDGDPTVINVRALRPHSGPSGGRGLYLVAELADDWGARQSDAGKTVWATISIGRHE